MDKPKKCKHKRKKEKYMKEKDDHEDKWILPSVNCRIKNAMEKKKHKKHKHKSKLEKFQSSGSDSTSEESETEWVEADQSDTKEIPKQRDAWMTIPNLGPTFSKSQLEEKDKTSVPDKDTSLQPGHHERELNPYWRSGGTGLPPVGEDGDSCQTQFQVGDGGYRWLQKAYKRAVEQAEEQGRSLEEIAKERWGSLERLQKLLDLAKQKARDKRDSRTESYSRSSQSKRNYSRIPKESLASFSKPINDEDNDERHLISPYERQEDRRSINSERTPKWKKKQNVEEHVTKRENAPTDDISLQKEESSTRNETKILPMTDDEMNKLAAQILKAELMGDEDTAKKLQNQLEAVRNLSNFGEKSLSDDREQESSVLLTAVDRRGLAKPFKIHAPDPYGKKKKRKLDCYDADGMRSHYFTDDHKHSLQEMFEKEKTTTAEEQNTLFSHLTKNKGISDDFDVDDMFMKKCAQTAAEDSQRELDRAVQATTKRNKIMDNCFYCFGNGKMQKHLIIAIATKVYLRVPHYHSLTSGHCQIIPMSHEIASTHLDEDVWEEIEVFKKTLSNMFESMNKDVIFFETSMNRKQFRHMIIECIPLPKDIGNLAPMYFKKAIMESEYEWSLNKKLIPLGQKDIRKSVPKELPYFCINYNISNGFAHVIEDESTFPSYFGQEVIAGMLDLDPHEWRKQKKETFEEQRQKVLKFAEYWNPFDWTQNIS